MQQWQALLDSAGEGIWGLDLDGRCTFVNRLAANTLGFASEELVGSNIHELIHHHYPDGRRFPFSECPIYEVLRRNKAIQQMTDTMFRKDGSSFIADMSAQPVTVEGAGAGGGGHVPRCDRASAAAGSSAQSLPNSPSSGRRSWMR